MPENSKPIKKGDDGVKDLIIASLEGKNTGGFDLDSVYCINSNYIVIEFLKCDCKYPGINPHTSHPRRYPWNRQKFVSLWNITKKMSGRLFLVNYEEPYNRFRVMEVTELDEKNVVKNTDAQWNFAQFKKWFQALNSGVLIELEDIDK